MTHQNAELLKQYRKIANYFNVRLTPYYKANFFVPSKIRIVKGFNGHSLKSTTRNQPLVKGSKENLEDFAEYLNLQS